VQNLHRQISDKPPSQRVPPHGPETAELEWWKSSDQIPHLVRIWTASPESAVILYLHGIEGHGRWFEETALELNKRGITVYAPDRRGAGSSRERRGHAASWKRLVDDSDDMLTLIGDRHPGKRFFIFGNCWGAKLAVSLAGRAHNADSAGLILTSPGISVQVDVPPIAKLGIGLSCLIGGTASFDIPLTPEHFTDVPEYLEYIKNDPLRLKQATAAFFVESLKLTRDCKLASKRLHMPVLVLQSGRDAIVNVEKIKEWFNGLTATDKTMSFFTEAAHSIDFDYQAEKYQNALSDWILAHANRAITGDAPENARNSNQEMDTQAELR